MFGCITAIGVSLPYLKTRERYRSIYRIGAIGIFLTYKYSRLRLNFASVVCEGQCKAFVVKHSLRPTASVQCEGDKAVSCGRKPPQGRHFHLAGVIMLINVGGAATEEHTAAAAAEQTPGKTVAIAERSALSTDFPLRGRAELEDCHSASASSSGTPNIRPSMTRFARLKGKRCRDSEPSPEKLSGTAPLLRCAPGWLRPDPTIFPTNHRDSTLLCPRPHRGEYRLRYLQ